MNIYQLILPILSILFATRITAANVQLLQELDNPNGVGPDWGVEVAMNGDGSIVAVSSDGGEGVGYTLVYERNNATGNWSFVNMVIPADRGFDSANIGVFTYDGDLLFIGAPSSGICGDGAGAVYVFRRNGASWSNYSQVATLCNDVTAEGFGQLVVISSNGSFVVVNSQSDSGTHYLTAFRRMGPSNWTLMSAPQSSRSLLPRALSSDGSLLVIHEQWNAWNSCVTVCELTPDSSGWACGQSFEGASYGFGYDADLSADARWLAIGDNYDQTGDFWGSVTVLYRSDDGTWARQGYLYVNDSSKNVAVGCPLAMSGDGTLVWTVINVIGGCPGSLGDYCVLLFERSGSNWSNGTIFATYDMNDYMSRTIGVSGTGNIAAYGNLGGGPDNDGSLFIVTAT